MSSDQGLPKKKTVTIVKEIKAANPKKQVYVSRPATLDDQIFESYSGNNSPQSPSRSNNGQINSRSILGDPQSYEQVERKIQGITSTKPLELTRNEGTGALSPRSASIGSRRKLTASQTHSLIDPSLDADEYLATLRHVQQNAYRLRTQERSKEATLTEYLPMSERFSLNKEGKVLTMWQERQRNWSRIQSNIAKKLSTNSTNLLMATTDDYRTKAEEYDLIQAAIPAHEKFGAMSWEMQLRGENYVNVPVGHVLSGLWCPVREKVTVPKIIRRAKLNTSTRPIKFADETFLAKKSRLKKFIQPLRPHNLKVADAEALRLTTVDLFEWAQMSSKVYFERLTEEEVEANGALLLNELPMQDNVSVDSPTSSGPFLQFHSPREVVFTSVQGEVTYRTISFTNSGSTMLSYSWKTVHENPTGHSEIGSMLENRGVKDKPREYILSKERTSFFCLDDSGQVLPGETINTVFSFCSRSGGGALSQSFMLETTPRCAVTMTTTQRNASQQSAQSPVGSKAGPPATAASISSPLYIRLHAHTHYIDKNEHNRLKVASQIDQLGVLALVQGVIGECIRRVRSPVKISEFATRQLTHFRNFNADLLLAISPTFGDALPKFITDRRYSDFMELHFRMIGFRDTVRERLEQLSSAEMKSENFEREKAAQEERLLLVRSALFPEKVLEIFDEVTADMLAVRWDISLSTMANELRRICAWATRIEELEAVEAAAAALREKERLKALRRAEDSDYEDEEEEEGDDEEKTGGQTKPAHPVVQNAASLLAEFESMKNSLVLRPLPDSSSAAKEALLLATGMVDSLAEQARGEAQLVAGDALPPLPRPFDNDETAAAWKKMVLPPADDPLGGKKKDKVAAPAATKAKGAGASEQQVSTYRRTLYNGLLNGMLDACVDGLFATMDGLLEREAMAVLRASPYCDVHSLSVMRSSDVTVAGRPGAVVFLSFEGGAFVGTGVLSAFDATKHLRMKALAPIRQAAVCGATAVVLIYESAVDASAPRSDWSILDKAAEVEKLLTNIATSDAEAYAYLSQKRKKNAPPVPVPPKYNLTKCGSVAELAVQLDAVRGSGTPDSTPVLLLETVCAACALVPPEPMLEEVAEDDDEAPIPLGLDDAMVRRKREWEALAPRRVVVPVSTGNRTVDVPCLTDIVAAINDVIISASAVVPAVWVEAAEKALFMPGKSVLAKVSPPAGKVLSSDVKRTLQWASVLPLLTASYALDLRKAGESLVESPDDPSVPDVAKQFAKLFPLSLSSPRPRLLVVLGGDARSTKFRMLDELVDKAEVIYITGELSLPFLALSEKITLEKHAAACAELKASCTHIMKKAQMRGVQIVLPVDLVTGDDAPKETDRQKCYLKVDKDTRDEGGEYEGEVRVVMLYTPPPVKQAPVVEAIVPDAKGKGKAKKVAVDTPVAVMETPVFSAVEHYHVPGYVLDIGPKSIVALKHEVSKCDALFVWGTVGCCELTGFQEGQKELVKAAAKLLNAAEEAAMSGTRKPLHTMVVGDSTFEWWSRILDSDGENGGDLATFGSVSFANRESILVTAALCLCESPAISAVVRRDLQSDEWMLDPPLPPKDQEEEEEDEEEEEEDEDDD